MYILNKLQVKQQQSNRIENQQNKAKVTLHKIKEALGRIENRQLQIIDSKNIKENEFRVFSQWGEDGIIQFLIRNVDKSRDREENLLFLTHEEEEQLIASLPAIEVE